MIRKVSTSGAVTSVAGVAGAPGSADGTGFANITPALFFAPSGTAAFGGYVYVADTNNQVIRKVNAAGVTSTIAGGTLSQGSTDGVGTAALFTNPTGIAIDSTGANIYVADTGNHTVRKIRLSDGTVTTLAGVAGYAGESMIVTTTYAVDPAAPTVRVMTVKRAITLRNPDSVQNLASSTSDTITAGDPLPPDTTQSFTLFNQPSSVAVDGSGNVYVADYNNDEIRKIDPSGVVTIFAGTGAKGSADGTGTGASFNRPRSLAIDGANLYVADTGNQVIRKISLSSANVTTIVGGGGTGASGSADGTGTAALFNGPSGIAVDSAGVLYVTDSNNQTIRTISASGVVTTIGGSVGLAGYADGIGNAARFNLPTGISFDPTTATLYLADYRNDTIRKGVSTSSGPGTAPPPITGTPSTGNGLLSHPEGITADSSNYIYVADTANNCIKRIGGDGTVTVFAGKEGSAGDTDGTGTAALFRGPTGITIDGSNNLYVSDTGNATIRKITSAAVVTTIAGSKGTRGSQDGLGTAATFQSPSGLAIDSNGYLYVADSVSNTIRRLNTVDIAAITTTPTSPAIPSFTVTTFAGKPGVQGDADGVGSNARFNNPTGLTLDGSGYLFIADTNSSTIRRMNVADITDGLTPATVVTPAATVTTFAGSAGISGSYDGVGSYALFNGPKGLTASSSYIYVADTENNLIRIITSGGVVSTVAGISGIAAYRDGANNTALFDHPKGIKATSFGLFVADTGNSAIRQVGSSNVLGLSLKSTTTPIPPTPPVTTPVTSSGGGSLELWFVGALLGLVACLRRPRA